MKKILIVMTAMILMTGIAKADWIGDAKLKLEAELKPLAGDLGAALGGGMYEPVKNGGLFGFDVGIRTSFAGISNKTKANITSLKDSDYIPAAWLYASKGLPFGIDIFGRYASLKIESSAETIDLTGFGIQYTLISDKLIKPVPGVSLLAAVNKLDAQGLDAQTITAAATVSKKLPFITPFATLAMDKTEMEVLTVKPKKTQNRILVGIELRLIPFTYFNIAASKSGSETGFQLGIGIKN
ncbi:MAG: hypothetical protein CVU78_03320 [Elusimicrobia bacterium HGW-Elusimicrobia-2]|nr:MAG: hypothetical protein CVU78_03320 [Elusimicrobia bacterium HGW-Elusimicrobia-2]